MAEYRITGERLTGIADQARRLAGVFGELTPYQIELNLSRVTPGGELQEKTVVPTSATQIVTPDDGYYGLSKVIVEAAGTVLPANAKVYYYAIGVGILDGLNELFTSSAG